MARTKYNGPLGYHPGQPDTVVRGGDTMHCVPFDMTGAGGSQIPESCSVLGCIGQQGFIS